MNYANNEIMQVKWRIVDVVIVYVGILLTLQIVILLAFLLLPQNFNIPPNANMQYSEIPIIILSVVEHLIYIVAPILWMKVKHSPLSALGLKSNGWSKYFLVGLISGFVFRSIILVPRLLLKQGLIIGNTALLNSIVFFIDGLILGPLGESILFTGFTFPPLAKKFGIKMGAVITALVFSAFHAFSLYPGVNFIHLFWFFVMEIIVLVLYWKTKSLFTPIGFHMAYNVLFAILTLFKSGEMLGKSPAETVQQLYEFTKCENWTAVKTLVKGGEYLKQTDIEGLKTLFQTEGLLSIHTEVLEENKQRARVIVTLVEKDDRKIGVEPVELISQNGVWKVEYTGTMPVSLKKENFQSIYEPYTHYRLGFLYTKSGYYHKAIQFYLEAIRMQPDYLESYWGLGCAYGALGQYDNALRAFRQAVDLDSNNAELQYNIGLTYFHLGQYNEALPPLSISIRLAPNCTKAYFLRGNVYLRIHQYCDAILDFAKIIAIDKNYKDAYVGLALAYKYMGDDQQSIENYRHVLKLDTRYADIKWIEKNINHSNFYTKEQLQLIKKILQNIYLVEK